jgi:hypothetical protein
MFQFAQQNNPTHIHIHVLGERVSACAIIPCIDLLRVLHVGTKPITFIDGR